MKELTTPITKFKATYLGENCNDGNCCVRIFPLPLNNALCVGALVMLLHNFIVELGLMNGAFGVIRCIRRQLITVGAMINHHNNSI